MKQSRNIIFQVSFGIIIILFLTIFLSNLSVNLIRTGMGLNFSWLIETSGFALAETSLPFKPSDNYAWALFIGWINSLKVILSGLIFATISVLNEVRVTILFIFLFLI